MRTRIAAGASAAIVLGLLVADTGGQAPARATIVGWTILGVDPIPAARAKRVAAVLRQLDPDLAVLTEVNPDQAASDIATALGPAYQPPVILAQQATVVQNIAFVFKTGVQVSNARLIDGTDLAEEPRSRRVLTANVTIGQFDFVLLGLHLKSGRTSTNRAQRSRQCTRINAFINEATAGAEKDVLVVGDYNMIPREGETRNDEVNFFAMSPGNFLRFLSSDFLAGRTSHISGCNPLRGNLLDGFAISRVHTREHVAGSLRLVTFSQLGTNCFAYSKGISDHLPVVARFRIDKDDD
jgi:endonuclease/exonuclease/phosphatase (EEP) superfamily protein YafD